MENDMNETITHIIMQKYISMQYARNAAFRNIVLLQEELSRAIKDLENQDNLLEAVRAEMLPQLPKLGSVFPGVR